MKIFNYVYITITMLLLLQFAGFPTALGGLFGFFNVGFNSDFSLNNTNIASSGITDYFLLEGTGLLATILGTGVAIGLYFTGKADIAIKAGIATATLTAFVPALYYPMRHGLEIGMPAWATGILALIFIPYTVAFFFALVEFVVGGTSD